MPLGQNIAEVFGAIPERIEVSGHEPTWRVTGGSFESVLAYVQQAFAGATVVAREDRHRWWPRVTLTVTRDPELAAGAPDVAAFATGGVPDPPPFASALDEIFTHQEELRMARREIPEQRDGS
jgi:hypothetical protein